ncbi:MAG: 4-hydroxy-3-methylbut-2-enyl diphosphate reductase [Planctomycetota bacterium]|nr:4-hydroxy-3-methylbut-2-enyl diphosphate reductase [Planctomycetota bacterium]
MEVRLAKKLGFCFGVEHAIQTAEKTLARRGGPIMSLGEIIHNRQVVEALSEEGLKVADDPSEASGTVLIRSHGEGPEVLAELRAKGARIVDATCVLVKRAQKIVEELASDGYRVVVIGQASHPEVRGVCGYAPDVICVDTPDELDRLPAGGKIGIICQTTHSLEHFGRMVGLIVARGYSEIKVVNTLCNEVRLRQAAAVELAREVEVMFVLGGMQSANTRELARLCAEQGARTHHLENWNDFQPEMVAGKKIAGITAGASTPKWVVEEFAEKLRVFEP